MRDKIDKMNYRSILIILNLLIGYIANGQELELVSYHQLVKKPINTILLSDFSDTVSSPLLELDDQVFELSLYCSVLDTNNIDSISLKLGTVLNGIDLLDTIIEWDPVSLPSHMSYNRLGNFLQVGMAESSNVDSVFLEFYFIQSNVTNPVLYYYPVN